MYKSIGTGSRADFKRKSVGDMMNSDLLIAEEDDDVLDVVERMKERGVRRIPIVNHRGGLVGIVSADDLLELLAEQLTDLAHIAARETRFEDSRLKR